MNLPMTRHSGYTGTMAHSIDPTALRRAPAWDRWQDVRTPETVDEAEAAVALVDAKIASLSTAATLHPDRAAEFKYAADRWQSKRASLVWALARLRAGADPLREKYDALLDRYNALVVLALECPDGQALIGLLQRKISQQREEMEALRFEFGALEMAVETRREEIRALTEANQAIKERNQMLIDAQGHGAIALATENERLRKQNAALQVKASAPPGYGKHKVAAAQHRAYCEALLVLDEVVTDPSTLSPRAAFLLASIRRALPEGAREQFEESQMPYIDAKIAAGAQS